MSYGFLALNDNNDVLISSDTKNLHFAGKATAPSGVTAVSSQSGGFVDLRYTITLPNRTSIPVPFFTMPVQTLTYSIAGVAGVNSGSSSKTWTINIIRTGNSQATNTYPEVYVFVDPSSVSVSDGYGFQVFNSDGSVSFDSRARPLAITGAVSVIPPTNPLTAASVPNPALAAYQCGSTVTTQFTPLASGSNVTVPNTTKKMYHYNALPQTQREVLYSGTTDSCTGFSAYGVCLGYEQTDSFASTYWCFYRGGIKGVSNTVIKAAWIPAEQGCHWTTSTDADFLWFFGPGGSSSSGGVWPYSDKTINLTAQTVIIADAARYD